MANMQKLPRVLRGAPPRSDGTEEGVDYSQLIDFHRCRYRWHLRRRRLIDRRQLIRAPDLGSACHAGFHSGLLVLHEMPNPSKKRTRKIFSQSVVGIRDWALEFRKERPHPSEEEQQELSNLVAEAIVITERAIEFFNPDRWRVVLLGKKPLVEQKIFWPIPGYKIRFYGTPDLVADDLFEGGRLVHDWKFRERFVSMEDENFDLQLPTYQYGLRQQSERIHTVGAIKWQFRSEVPKDPKRNKDGSFSRQRIATTWENYAKVVSEAGQDPKLYEAEMKQKLDVEFHRMHPIYRNDFMVNQMWSEITLPLTKTYLEAKRFPRVMHTWGCTGCWAREFCMAELRGEDTNFLLQTSFINGTDPKPRLVLRAEDIEFVE